METNFTISIMFIIITGIVIIATIAFHDFRTLQATRRLRKTKRRAQPLVSVVVDENISKESLASIRHNDYRHYEIVFAGEHTTGKFILSLQHNVILPPTAMSQSVASLHDFPSWEFVEIKPILARPQKISELFRLYHIVVLAPFISLRAALTIPPNLRQPWPVLRRANTPLHRIRSKLYSFMRWTILIMNAALISYIAIIAFTAAQPLYLITYLCALMIWIVVCVVEYPHFSYRQKITYILLSPVSFWFFFLYAFYAPLVPIVRTITNKVASLFWRAHRQTIA